MNRIIKYINERYAPLSIIVYGSYANDTNDENSDFDALVISSSHKKFHDTSFFEGIQLDIFVYPIETIDENMNLSGFVQLIDSKVVFDTDNIGESLKSRVISYIEKLPLKSHDDLKADIDWCTKMLARAKRGDAEGMFRFHWVLVDSLEVYSVMMQQFYRGPKKTLEWMKENHSKAYMIYHKALSEFTIDSLSEWILYLRGLWDSYE